MTIKPVLISCVMLCSSVAFANDAPCPADLVEHWKTFAAHTENADAIPRFLLDNHCLERKGSTDFAQLTLQRLDNPEQLELVDQMYARLNWPMHNMLQPKR